MHVIPYLFFNGRSREAIAFYKDAIGITDEMVMRFGDSPEQAGVPPENKDLVMHAQFKVGDTTIFMSDGCGGGETKFEGSALAIAADTVPDAQRIFDALAKGGKVTQPLTETFFAKTFGMVQDKFGMHWMLSVSKPM
jgi:PhnB protein